MISSSSQCLRLTGYSRLEFRGIDSREAVGPRAPKQEPRAMTDNGTHLQRPSSSDKAAKGDDSASMKQWMDPVSELKRSWKNIMSPPPKAPALREKAAMDQASDLLASESKYLTDAWVANREKANQVEAKLMEPWGAAEPWKVSKEPQSMLMYCHAHAKEIAGGIKPVTQPDDHEGLGAGV